MRLHEAIAAQARRTPTACALLFEGAAYSFAWMDRRSDATARHLRRQGVRRGDVVAVHMERSPEMVATLIGCLKANAAYLPLDPGFPEARLEMILSDAAPTALITQRTLGDLNCPAGIPRLLADDCADVIGDEDVFEPLSPEDLAYVLYTSGSTGRPKGVEVTHRGVMNLLASFMDAPGFGPSGRMLAATTTGFDISVVELFLPLTCGGCIVLASSDTAHDPEKLAVLIDEADCTHAQATPSLWRYLLDSGWKGKPDLTVISGGETLTRDLADRLIARSRAVWNVYGPTETTVWSTRCQVQPGAGTVPIGWPIAETTLRLLDEAGHAVQDGEAGELYIGGLGVVRGYRHRPDLTDDRFSVLAGERVYRTGDLARRRADGALEYLGRTDHQVKIRGFRVELEEVEAALAGCDFVRASAVVMRERFSGEAELVAFVASSEASVVALRKQLGERLPNYMIPSRFVFLQALPMTPNGKIDRNALPNASDFQLAAVVSSDRPVSDTEGRLTLIWSAILGLPDIERTDNFFDIGGYSLLTVTLLRRIQEEFGRRLSLASLFTVANLAGMAALIDAPQATAPGAIPLQPSGDRPPLIWLDVGPQLRALAMRMAPDQPFVGINLDSATEGELSGLTTVSVAAVAERIVELLRRFQSNGPYYLGGWCRWGSVAYAAASQLQREGETVGLLVLLDTVNCASPYQLLRRAKRRAARWQAPRTEVAASFSERVEIASRRYQPPPYAGDVLLLRSADTERDFDRRSGWADRVRGRLSLVDLPGDHRSVLQSPFVDATSQAVRSALESAQARCT